MSEYRNIVINGLQLKLGRIAAGMTVREMAEAANINRNSVLRVEAQLRLPVFTYAADKITKVLLEKNISFRIDNDAPVIILPK